MRETTRTLRAYSERIANEVRCSRRKVNRRRIAGGDLTAAMSETVWQFSGREHEGYVYFILCDEYVKIGFTANVRRRVKDLAAIIPHDIHLIGVVFGPPQLESALHSLLTDYHHKGEWFRAVPDLLAAISAVAMKRPRLEPVDTNQMIALPPPLEGPNAC
jgi:T5orf172 domain.